MLQVGQRYGLPVIAPVDDAGVFTDEAGPFAGMDAMTDGSKKVVDVLRGAGVMLKVCNVFALMLIPSRLHICLKILSALAA